MRRAFHVALAAALLTPAAVWAGRYAGEFLALGGGARGLALGQAMTALTDDAYSSFWNPAGLARVDRRCLSGMAATQFGSLSDPMGTHAQLGIAWPIGGGNLALHYVRFQVDDIPRFPGYEDADHTFEERRRLIEESGGMPTGWFQSVDQALLLGFAKRNEPTLSFGWLYHDIPLSVPFGVNVKLIHSELDGSAGSGIGLDAGVQLRAAVEDLTGLKRLGRLSAGARLENFTNTGLKWDGGEDAIHYYHVLGLAWEAAWGDLSWTLSRDWDHHYDTQIHSGAELRYRGMALRAGHQGRDGRLTYGAGFRLGPLDVDYAGLDHDLGRLHRMSFIYAF